MGTMMSSVKSSPDYSRLQAGKGRPAQVEDTPRLASRHKLRKWSQSRVLHATLVFTIFWVFWRCSTSNYVSLAPPKINLPERVIHSWAQYTPAFPVGVYEVPTGCAITQVTYPRLSLNVEF